MKVDVDNLDIDVVYADWLLLESTRLEIDNITMKFSCNDKGMIEKMERFYEKTEENRYDGELIYITREKNDRRYLAPYDSEEHRLVVEGVADFGYVKSLLLGLLGHLQEKEGKYVLHAGISGDTAYIGPTGAGKTTHSLLESKEGSNFLTDDWSYFEDNVAYKVEDNIMLSKEFVDLLNLDLKLDDENFSGREKYIFRISDLLENSIESQEINNFVLLKPEKDIDIVQDVDEEEFVDYVIKSTYHLPFNYFDKDSNNKHTEKRRDFWGQIYKNSNNVFAVSTRKLDPIKTHKLIRGCLK